MIQVREQVLSPQIQLPKRGIQRMQYEVPGPGAEALVDLGEHLAQRSRQVDLLEILERPPFAHDGGEGPPLLALGLGRILGWDEMEEVLMSDR
jgi:hypothetical protein